MRMRAWLFWVRAQRYLPGAPLSRPLCKTATTCSVAVRSSYSPLLQPLSAAAVARELMFNVA